MWKYLASLDQKKVEQGESNQEEDIQKIAHRPEGGKSRVGGDLVHPGEDVKDEEDGINMGYDANRN